MLIDTQGHSGSIIMASRESDDEDDLNEQRGTSNRNDQMTLKVGQTDSEENLSPGLKTIAADRESSLYAASSDGGEVQNKEDKKLHLKLSKLQTDELDADG